MRVIIPLLSLFTVGFAYDYSTDCFGCLASVATTNKFCLPYEESPDGYCCNMGNTADICSTSNRYFCTDLASSINMRIYFCPNKPNKCFTSTPNSNFLNTVSKSNKVIYLKDQAIQVAGSTLEFGLGDTCGWRIIADT